MNVFMRITRDFIRKLSEGPHTFYNVDMSSAKQVHTHCSFLRKYEGKVLTAEVLKDGTVKFFVGHDGQGLKTTSPNEQGSLGESNGTGSIDQG